MTTPSTTTKEHQMTTIQLTPAQHAILAYAIEHTGGKIEWFPDNIKGGARTKVLEGLFNRALITRDSTDRSEEHTSELQSLMRISYAVFCLKKKKTTNNKIRHKCPVINNKTQ